mmetsp:Transcript_1118/g.3149  ORF Transcript_1118/g.3149 Transcript_1118/m.3149 type:complete len:344 (-) Transcript_1118:388-1419(-)
MMREYSRPAAAATARTPGGRSAETEGSRSTTGALRVRASAAGSSQAVRARSCGRPSCQSAGTSPQTQTRPASSIATLCLPPAAIATARAPSAPRGTRVGSLTDSSLPRPRRPCSPQPQAYTSPCAERKSEWRSPAEARTTGECSSDPSTRAGRSAGASEPEPSWPSAPDPKAQARPWASTTRVWSSPAAARTAWTPSSAATRRGTSRLSPSPWPSRPAWPQPHVNTEPDCVTNTEWEKPAATSTTCSAASACTNTGSGTLSPAPRPSAPSAPSPNEKTSPEAVATSVKPSPAATAAMAAASALPSTGEILGERGEKGARDRGGVPLSVLRRRERPGRVLERAI